MFIRRKTLKNILLRLDNAEKTLFVHQEAFLNHRKWIFINRARIMKGGSSGKTKSK